MNGNGVSVPAKGTTVLTVTEPMPDNAFDWGFVMVACDFAYRGIDDIGSPSASDRADVPGMRVDLNGVVSDSGTGVSGVRVVLTTESHCPILGETRTDATGKFTLKQMPAGIHKLYLLPPAGWHIEGATRRTCSWSAPGRRRT